ncbi:MAG TPA: hypothetical protein VM146_09865 [Steroidobacteraceae bacterium]|nr:hypothetical protein [Steroidobacteraceae bacterium]
MKLQRVWVSIGLSALSGAALADVTVTTQTTGKMVIDLSGDAVNMIKGKKQRSDSTLRGKAQTLIIDIDGRRFVDLDAKKKVANVTPLDSIAEQLQKVGVGTLEAKLTKTAQTKQIAGHGCTVHDISVSMPFSPTGNSGDGMDLTMNLSGTVCLATGVPGLADYQGFYRAAAESGFIFGDPRAAKSPTGAAQAKAYAALTRKMAEAGMALESNINIDAAGSGPMAALMGKLAKGNIVTTVTKIETGDLPAASFEVPADYKVKTKN